jgi:Rieske Fe-S protein
MTTEHATDPSVPVTTDAEASAPSCSCWSRRESLMVAGVAVAGTAGLTACGSSAGEAVSSAASGAASAASDAIAKADIPVGGGKVFDALKVVVTQPTAGDYKAFSAICTHQGCTVNGVSNGVITCPCHGSTFDIATGEVKQGPATQALPTKSVTVGADGIKVT